MAGVLDLCCLDAMPRHPGHSPVFLHTADDESSPEPGSPPSAPRAGEWRSKVTPHLDDLMRGLQGGLSLPRESEEGAVEYKLKLLGVCGFRLEQLCTQFVHRLHQGRGRCTYFVGVEDDGTCVGLGTSELDESLGTLAAIAARMNARVERVALCPMQAADRRVLARVDLAALREVADAVSCEEIRVAFCGATDAGKSTLAAVLTHGSAGHPALDDGQGRVRSKMFTHRHELVQGRTSAISVRAALYRQSVGAASGPGGRGGEVEVLNYSSGSTRGSWPVSQAELAKQATRVAFCFDLSGDSKSLKTTTFGLTTLAPHLTCICVPASELTARARAAEGGGEPERAPPLSSVLPPVAVEHLAMAAALQSGVFVAVTKCDPGAEGGEGERLKRGVDLLCRALRESGLEPILAHGPGVAAPPPSPPFPSAAAAPVFCVSSVTGAGIKQMHDFLCRAPKQPTAPPLAPIPRGLGGSSSSLAGEDWVGAEGSGRCSAGSGALFRIHQGFKLTGEGHPSQCIASGLLLSGELRAGQRAAYYLRGEGDREGGGPPGEEEEGRMCAVEVRSIERCKVPVRSIQADAFATVQLCLCEGGEGQQARFEQSFEVFRKGAVLVGGEAAGEEEAAGGALTTRFAAWVAPIAPMSPSPASLQGMQVLVHAGCIRQLATVTRAQRGPPPGAGLPDFRSALALARGIASTAAEGGDGGGLSLEFEFARAEWVSSQLPGRQVILRHPKDNSLFGFGTLVTALPLRN